jgi:hypothetical protein
MTVHQRNQRLAWVVMVCLAAGLLTGGCGFLPGGYAFDPAELAEIAGEVNASSGDDAVAQVHQALLDRGLPVASQLNWSFNSGSGLSGQIAPLYVRPREYLLLAAVPATSHWQTGEFIQVDIRDFVVFGELNASELGQIDPLAVGAGEQVFVPAGDLRDCQTTNGAWVMEYGRGLYPADLYAVAFTSNLPIAQSMVVYVTNNIVTMFIRNMVSDAMGLPPGFSWLTALQ